MRVRFIVLALVMQVSCLLVVVRCFGVMVRCFEVCLFRHGVVLFVEVCSRFLGRSVSLLRYPVWRSIHRDFIH